MQPPHVLCVALLAFAAAGCGDGRSRAVSIARDVGLPKLRADLYTLVTSPTGHQHEIPQTVWPESVRRFRPLSVQLHAPGVLLVLHRAYPEQRGLLVLLDADDDPGAGGSGTGYEGLGDGLFWCREQVRSLCAAPSVPEAVQIVTRHQIKSYFGTNSVAGVPLVDPAVNWRSFTNWPNEFQFLGQTYQLRVDMWGGDYAVPLRSRSEIKPGMSFLAHYRIKGTSNRGILSPEAIWREDGALGHKGLNWKDAERDGSVFVHQFGPTGRFGSFSWIELETSLYRIQYYTPDGELVGDYAVPNRGPHSAGRYIWNGESVSAEEFNAMTSLFLGQQWREFRAQRGAPTDGNQPTHPSTNRTSSAAGFRR